MKKITMLFIVILFTIFLVSCSNNKNNLDLPSEEELKELPYYDYLKDDNPIIVIKIKDYGQMLVELFPDVAKITVDNMLSYIASSAYDNSSFHRIIKDFMIQGGIVTNNLPAITGEFMLNKITNNLNHHRGVISMARTSVYNSATSQFFIVHEDSLFLDGQYAGFGGLIKGFDILDELAIVSTNFNDAPLTKVVIESIKVELRGYKQS